MCVDVAIKAKSRNLQSWIHPILPNPTPDNGLPKEIVRFLRHHDVGTPGSRTQHDWSRGYAPRRRRRPHNEKNHSHSQISTNYLSTFLGKEIKKKTQPTMVCQKKLFAFFVVLVLGLLVPGPSMTGVEAMHLGGGGGGGMSGVEVLLAAGLIAKLLSHHHHHEQHHHHGHHHHG
ncbi:hypothetical protein TNCT_551041 [Trichonephila clavata]|uniref:Uncharacterized protein n=1 Tax=Trichonephila clavata TaxID=2740835 RepID=A0A8X6KDX2_TRICU|nr:hypothetical protein TNCT_551041 [Trichonephila clavata]